MQVLVIPDVHLKPYMFQRASALMKLYHIKQAVCLMDIPDDWKQQYNLDLYIQTFEAVLDFQEQHPNTLWCYGNHDVCYLWNQRETGYSKIAPYTVCEGLQKLQDALPDPKQLAFIQRIDNVLFMHGGLTEDYALFAEGYLDSNFTETAQAESSSTRLNTDDLIRKINGFGYGELWDDSSPLWFRPQVHLAQMYKEDELLQVVGHTPVKKLTQTGNLISCDVFSLTSARKPFGSQEFLLLDTETWKWSGIS